MVFVQSWHSDRTKDRGWHIMASCTISFVGYIILATSVEKSVGLSYFALFLDLGAGLLTYSRQPLSGVLEQHSSSRYQTVFLCSLPYFTTTLSENDFTKFLVHHPKFILTLRMTSEKGMLFLRRKRPLIEII